MFAKATEALNSYPFYYRFMKGATSIAYMSMIWISWRFACHETSWRVTFGAVGLSAFWLVLTRMQLQHLFRTYFDVLSRLEVITPLILGVFLSLIAVCLPGTLALHTVALGELLVWIYIYSLYRRNRERYEIVGHGPVPVGCWVSPPASVLKPGDLLLTSGQVANRLSESVGHAEMVVKMPDGSMKAFSSYMTLGAVLQPLDQVAAATLKHGHYIVMRLKQPWTEEQSIMAAQIAIEMIEECQKWRDKTNCRYRNIIEHLFLPAQLKSKLISKIRATGYDWLGLFCGRLAKDHWTCIAACLELYKRLGIPTNPYGSGLLGFGTTLFDPIMPVRFLSDPAFRLLMLGDQVQDRMSQPST